MTLTLHFGTIIVPIIFTLISIAIFGYVAFSERNDNGYMSGFVKVLSFYVAIAITVSVWLVWGITSYFK
jgi:hypothetical protein